MRYRYFVDFRHGISVSVASFFLRYCGIGYPPMSHFSKSSICLTYVATAPVVLRHRHTKNECDFLMFSHRLYFLNVGLKSLIILFCLFCQNLLSSFCYLFPWRLGKVITARLWSKHRRARDLKRNNSPLCDSFQYSERENNGRGIR